MLHQHTNKEKLISLYFNRINLQAFHSNSEFWRYLYKNHKKGVIKQLEKMVTDRDRAQEEKAALDELYIIKNSSLKLSVDFAAFSTDLYKNYLKKFIRLDINQPQNILDIGCDNGIVACFYALIYPEAEIVGIDPNENSIRCATKLAQKLGLKNISFIRTGIEDIKEYFPSHYFDVITSVRSFHEIVPLPQHRHWSIKDLNVNILHEDINLVIVRDLLKNTASKFITFERLPSFADYVWWIKALRAAGLYVDWQRRGEIDFHELGEAQAMPIFEAMTRYQEKIPYEAIQQFYAGYPDINFDSHIYFQDMAAELAFNQLEVKSIICGVQINYVDNMGDLRMELWQTAEQLFLYQYSNVGFRELKVFPQSMRKTLIREIEAIENTQANTANKTFYYSNLIERKMLTSPNPVA